MLRLKLHAKLKCSKHPRYNPAITGPGAVVGGCATCWSLWEVQQQALKLVELVSRYEAHASADGGPQ